MLLRLARFYKAGSVREKAMCLTWILFIERIPTRQAWHALFVVLAIQIAFAEPAQAEYGDVVINNYAETQGMRPVVFPHWFHRIRYACKVCHADLGFKFKAGGNDITMSKIIEGQFCGACHNGSIAWSVKNCNLCHSGKPGATTQVHESTTQELTMPTGRGKR